MDCRAPARVECYVDESAVIGCHRPTRWTSADKHELERTSADDPRGFEDRGLHVHGRPSISVADEERHPQIR